MPSGNRQSTLHTGDVIVCLAAMSNTIAQSATAAANRVNSSDAGPLASAATQRKSRAISGDGLVLLLSVSIITACGLRFDFAIVIVVIVVIASVRRNFVIRI